jgi:hypothetical protein
MYYKSDKVIEEFYKNLLDGASPDRIHIPRSDVFYVREAIRVDTGVTYTLDHVEWAKRKEGHLKPQDCFKPDMKREWDT